ncbi:peptide-methionine (R)-S-oxide reductase MsrB [Serratia sp. UGAL515B_01]|uniref:peptide-methionine (R)-S-oxide reductase MsrB n=1 Tax=Serratia sp. UGAL515B_01 TaxID=2986763 RepID=UPI002955D645|nr:peptide-methionine (R)-S-oxide reductase MsrB [Serratia sp. UGAL515B_01]WON77903.1 peptide-methionine (R)-S-oxide reductase MsrB [Serratia sp. UGAL515B_01]
MINRRYFILGCGAVTAIYAVGLLSALFSRSVRAEQFAINYTAEQWRQRLSARQYAILREEGTEAPYSSPLNDEHRQGVFSCAGCDQPLFYSNTKFDSHTGWPSFWQPIEKAVATRTDSSFGMVREEVHCSRCGGHLGHVFDDGPAPTGLRYCMNGLAMVFTPQSA